MLKISSLKITDFIQNKPHEMSIAYVPRTNAFDGHHMSPYIQLHSATDVNYTFFTRLFPLKQKSASHKQIVLIIIQYTSSSHNFYLY